MVMSGNPVDDQGLPEMRRRLEEHGASIHNIEQQLAVISRQLQTLLQGNFHQRIEGPEAREVAPAHRPQFHNPAIPVEGSSEVEDDYSREGRRRQNRRDHEYCLKVDIPSFNGNLDIEGFLDWLEEVEGFFDYTEMPEDRKVKLVAFRLKEGASVWWNQLKENRRREGRGPVMSWTRMKQLLMRRFLPTDYEQYLFEAYQNCVQGNRSIHEYTEEFLRLAARNNLYESEPQQAARYLRGLEPAIRKKIGVQMALSVHEARDLAMRAEVLTKQKAKEGIAQRSKSEINTPRVQMSEEAKSDPTSSQLKLERSKTEGQRKRNLRAEEAAQIYDDKISVQQKLKLLNRIATVKDDGTVEFDIPGDVDAQALGLKSDDGYNTAADEEAQDTTGFEYIPPMQIVMLIVGSRGDVQPFIAIGKRLQDYGHRVRLATHSNFKEFVWAAGLEFYPLGGDPKVLAGYMVKNKGFLPLGPSEIPIQRNQVKDIIYSLLPACKEPDIYTGIPFKADAIIANPPAYGHVHVAESLQVPIHIFFTMPWTPTNEFPHPLSRVKQPAGYRLSYQVVDSLIWLGVRDMINDVRKKRLKLRPVTYLSGSQGSDSDVPHGYIWSPHLVPKPKDWGHKVDVVGFCFLDLASNYEPPESLLKWLEAGPKPIYIGFGSLPVQEPQKMTQIIVEALEQTGQRGIINKGGGGLGELAELKDFIYLLDNVPHDWLFLRCKAVVHHGGAGTTAAGLKAACPTTIVPFFGDQPLWGERVHARRVGPQPIPVDEFSLSKLVDAIKFMLDPEVKERAVELARAMENEDGVTGAVKAFFKHLPKK